MWHDFPHKFNRPFGFILIGLVFTNKIECSSGAAGEFGCSHVKVELNHVIM